MGKKRAGRAAEIAAEAAEAKRLKAKEEAAAALKKTGGDAGPAAETTGTVIAPESEIVAALDANAAAGGGVVVPPASAVTQAAVEPPSGRPAVTSTFFDTPAITPADLALQQAAKGQQAAAAARQAAEQARVERTLRRLFGQPSDRDFMPAEAGGMPSVVDGSPFGYELGGQGGESLLDFENPNPPPPTSQWMPRQGGASPGVTRPSTYDVTVPVVTRTPPSANPLDNLQPSDIDYIPQADGKRPKRVPPPVDGEPAAPRTPYGISNTLVGRLASAVGRKAGPYVGPVVSKGLAGSVDAAAAIGGAGLLYSLGRPLVQPMMSDAYNAMFPPASGSPPAQSPAPGLPQQQAPANGNGEEPEYMRQLRDSTIGNRNSSDIIRNLSRNRGMA